MGVARSMTMRDDRKYWLLAIVTAIPVLLVTIVYPFRLDPSIYQAMAVDLVRFHRIPYIGTWDMNFPGIVYIHSLAILLFGNSETGFLLLNVIMRVGTVAIFCALLIRFVKPKYAYAICIILAFSFLARNRDYMAERDGFVLFFLVGTLAVLYNLKSRLEEDTLSMMNGGFFGMCIGALSGCAVAIRPTYGLWAVVMCIAAVYLIRKNRIVAFLGYGFGFLLPLFLLAIPYFSIPGGLDRVYTSIIRFNFDVFGSPRYRVSFLHKLFAPSELLLNGITLAGLAVMFLVKRSTSKLRNGWNIVRKGTFTPNRFDIVLFIALYFSIRIGIYTMGKFFFYHYEALILLIIILAGIALEILIASLSSRKARMICQTLAICVVGLVCYPWRIAGFFVEGLQSPGNAIEYARDKMDPIDGAAHHNDIVFARYLRSCSTKDTRIEFCAIDPFLLWRTELQPTTSFTTVFATMMRLPNGGFANYQKEWQAEYVDSLRVVRPKFIILESIPDTFINYVLQPPSALPQIIPEFGRLLDSAYVKDTAMDYGTVYRRKSGF